MRKHLRSIASIALAFCVAAGLFASPASALPEAISSMSASAPSFTAPNDPDFSKQWQFKPWSFMGDAFPYTYIDKAWALMPASAQKVRVAVLDEGFDVDHPDLAANINKNLAWNTHEKNHDVSPEPGSKGHGTHVSGIFGAVANNGIGIAGNAKNLAEIVPIKTSYTHDNGAFAVDMTETAKGIDYAVANGCKIINMSNGAYFADGYRHAALEAAIQNAVDNGVMLVAAAGNKNISDTMFPSDHDDVISVTSATQMGEKASYSDFSAHKNIAAPGGGQKAGSSLGGEIYSTVPGGYGEKHGTSMAAPFVTGVLTLVLAANPNLTADEATDIIYKTATDLGATGRDDVFGHGLINAEASVAKALEMKNSGSTPGTGNGNNGGTPGTGGGNNTGTGSGDNSGGNNSGTGSGDTGGGSTPGTGGNNPGTGSGSTPGTGGNNSGTGSGSNPGTGGSNPGTGGGDTGGGNVPSTGSGTNTGNKNESTADKNIAPDTKPSPFKVTFKTNGGKKLKAALIKKSVFLGSKYGKLPSPKRSGYKFCGWYTKKHGGKKITAKTIVMIAKSHRLYARWKRK